MADDIVKILADTRIDSKSLQEVVNGDDNKQVTTRLGATYPSVQKAIKLMTQAGVGFTAFQNKTLMSGSSLGNGYYAIVTNDNTLTNNGLYLKTSGVFKKVLWDIDERQKSYTDAAKDAAISAAATDAKTKADAAKDAAISYTDVALKPIALDSSIDLNDLKIKNTYTALSSAIATLANNYPVENGGVLEVMDFGLSQRVVQKYTTTLGKQFTRRFTGTWSEWDALAQETTLNTAISAAANSVDSLKINLAKIYPFIYRDRGVPYTSGASELEKSILSIKVRNADPGYYYALRYFNYKPSADLSGTNNSWVMVKILKSSYATGAAHIDISSATTTKYKPDVALGINYFTLTASDGSDTSYDIALDPSLLVEKLYLMTSTLSPSYQHVIDPLLYQIRPEINANNINTKINPSSG